MDIKSHLRTIRKELVIKDEPLKAWKLLELFKEVEGLDEERKNTYGMIRHMYSEEEFIKAVDIPVDDCEAIEPKHFTTHAGERYARYQWVLDDLVKNKVKTYLDLGCYVGSLVTTAASKGIKSYGVDLTSKAIEKARQRAKEAGLDKLCTFYLANVEKFDKVKADAVSSLEVLEHTVDPEKYIKHLLSLSNGWCYISTPDGPYGNGEGNLTMPGGWEWDGKGVRGHVRVFVKETLSEILDKCHCEYEFVDLQNQLLNVRFKEAK